ncbi:low-density lipoprotein receptor-related protein 4-like isoform X2 [Artemia franciscana]|uniref:low-density lipoprotein receptor-related protein 4-like isoform X2 n=1 Tax=Artemia franciscana TaxID=6661 RepID=UPI0032D9E845
MKISTGMLIFSLAAHSFDFDFDCGSGCKIPKEWICDGEDDCGPDCGQANVDETPEQCQDQCSPYTFDCGHGYCIRKERQCDGINDCEDKCRGEADCTDDESPELCLDNLDDFFSNCDFFRP